MYMTKQNKVLVVSPGELWLKSDFVRSRFMDKLKSNIERMLGSCKHERIRVERDKIFIYDYEDECIDALRNVFGISVFYPATEVETSFDEIKRAVMDFGKEIGENESFAIKVNRSWKGFEMTSKEMEERLGALIERRVDLTKPDVRIFVDVRKNYSYIYTKRFKGAGGLPVSTAGKVVVLFSGGIDSSVASYLMMRRGCSMELVYIYNYPFSPKNDREKVIEVARILKRYYPDKLRLHIIPFAKIEESVLNSCTRKYTCLIGRRIMFRLAERIAGETGAKALITGENIAQVASQTLDNLITTTKAVNILILRPVIGMDKAEIMDIAKDIGTYDISCTVSSPCPLSYRKPATKSTPETIEDEESNIDGLEELMRDALEHREVVEI